MDIAFTTYRDRTLMVLMYSPVDEHDALYRDVFLNTMESMDRVGGIGQ